MNILIDIRSLTEPQRTGVGEYTFELLNALFQIDRENQYYLFYNSYHDVSSMVPKWSQANVHVVATRWPNKLLHTFISFRLVVLDTFVQKAVKRNLKFEILNLDVWFSPNITFSTISKKTKHILTIHDLSFEHFPECFSWKRRLWHWFLNPRKQCERADIILTPSESTKRDVIETYSTPEEKVVCAYPGMVKRDAGSEMQEVVEKYALPEKYILFVGTIEPRKNILGLIEAFKTSSLFFTHYSLLIVGKKGWKCESILDAIDATPNVRYLGYVEESEKQVLYTRASLFVYPSLYEGFGFPVLEALSHGVPVVTSNRSSLPEIVGDHAYLVNPNDVADIRRGMEDVLGHEKIAHASDAGIEHFLWEKTAQQFLSLYENRH